jgi:copper homeostasis protein CutC
MFIPKNRGFKRQYVYGGAGLFDSVASFFTRLFTSSAAKQLASTALDAGKSAAKDVGRKALDVGKNAAINAGKKLIEKGVTRVLTPKSQSIIQKYAGVPMEKTSPDQVAKRAQSILSKYINTGAQNINNLIDGSGVGGAHQQKAIAIQDLVRKLNGSGLKVV